MTVATRKFNPGFLSEDELVASFCVRTHEFESIIETLRGCTGNSNQHQIVIGPRGSGKTTLLLRVAAEIDRDDELSQRFFPIRFAEESYEVSTAGEFWLKCLSQLSTQAPSEQNGPDLRRTFGELRTIQDDRTLADGCLGGLLDYSDGQGKRLVLLVENLNMMFRDMVDRDAGWRLRHTLQNEPRIVLLASATSRFEEIDNPDNALYDLLQVHSLKPLDTGECATLWATLSGRSTSEERVRPLEILTGGSPRLMAIVARFSAGESPVDLMTHLLELVDDHTEYFKSHIEFLPPQERRVYLALADLWKPATTREIAERARIPTNTCSAQLRRLSERGTVKVAGGTDRRKEFYLTERLYNIYYLLRRPGGPERVVEALLKFMAAYYSSSSDHSLRSGLLALPRNPVTAKNELATALRMVADADRLTPGTAKALIKAAAELGYDSVLELIETLPSTELLLPVKAALESERGGKPRVSREVEEVASDVRRDLVRLEGSYGYGDTQRRETTMKDERRIHDRIDFLRLYDYPQDALDELPTEVQDELLRRLTDLRECYTYPPEAGAVQDNEFVRACLENGLAARVRAPPPLMCATMGMGMQETIVLGPAGERVLTELRRRRDITPEESMLRHTRHYLGSV